MKRAIARFLIIGLLLAISPKINADDNSRSQDISTGAIPMLHARCFFERVENPESTVKGVADIWMCGENYYRLDVPSSDSQKPYLSVIGNYYGEFVVNHLDRKSFRISMATEGTMNTIYVLPFLAKPFGRGVFPLDSLLQYFMEHGAFAADMDSLDGLISTPYVIKETGGGYILHIDQETGQPLKLQYLAEGYNPFVRFKPLLQSLKYEPAIFQIPYEYDYNDNSHDSIKYKSGWLNIEGLGAIRFTSSVKPEEVPSLDSGTVWFGLHWGEKIRKVKKRGKKSRGFSLAAKKMKELASPYDGLTAMRISDVGYRIPLLRQSVRGENTYKSFLVFDSQKELSAFEAMFMWDLEIDSTNEGYPSCLNTLSRSLFRINGVPCFDNFSLPYDNYLIEQGETSIAGWKSSLENGGTAELILTRSPKNSIVDAIYIILRYNAPGVTPIWENESILSSN